MCLGSEQSLYVDGALRLLGMSGSVLLVLPSSFSAGAGAGAGAGCSSASGEESMASTERKKRGEDIKSNVPSN